MKRAELQKSIMNVLDRCGAKTMEKDDKLFVKITGDQECWMQVNSLEGIAAPTAALAFARCLTEDDDTRRLRWQYGELNDRGNFNLEL